MLVNVEKSNIIHKEFPEEMIQRKKELIQYQTTFVEVGFKYLGFTLKPNCYSFHDWVWLYKNIERRINIWENQYLSRGERLILLKAVLQSSPVYWASIAYIPKGILTKIRKLCFSFLWTASKQSEGIALANWKTLAKPKKLGGWGIKNIDLFSKALAAKTLWRFIQNLEALWAGSF